MGSGDELRLRFDADGAAAARRRAGRRDFLLLVDGWAKDGDANTAFSQTVEPLPFHGMSAYPYPPAERFPDDAVHRAYRERYNTRPALRLLRPLSTVAPTEARRPDEDADTQDAGRRRLRRCCWSTPATSPPSRRRRSSTWATSCCTWCWAWCWRCWRWLLVRATGRCAAASDPPRVALAVVARRSASTSCWSATCASTAGF